jgi:hypothetical protein
VKPLLVRPWGKGGYGGREIPRIEMYGNGHICATDDEQSDVIIAGVSSPREA